MMETGAKIHQIPLRIPAMDMPRKKYPVSEKSSRLFGGPNPAANSFPQPKKEREMRIQARRTAIKVGQGEELR
jgi:hypothetical protein